MDFFNKLAEQFIRMNRRLRQWKRVVSALAAIVVFATTYALVLPAITLDKETAQQQPGIEVAASETNVEERGSAAVDAVEEPEEEPAVEETAEPEEIPEQINEREPENNNGDDEPADVESDSQSEESLSAEEAEYIEDTEPEDNNKDEEPGKVEDEQPDDDGVTTVEEASTGVTETLSDEILTTDAISSSDDLAASIEAGEVKLITEKTQLVYEYIDEEYEKNKDKKAGENNDQKKDDVDDGYFVYAEFDGSAKLPEGVELQVKEITKESDPDLYAMYCEKTLSEVQDKYDENTGITFAKFYDISFVYQGIAIEPGGDVKIRIEYKREIEVRKDEKVDAIHFDKEEEKPEVIESEINPEDKEKDKKSREAEAEPMKAVEFTTDRFSVYGVVGTGSITATFLSADGNTYEVTVTCDTDANIPAGSELVVSEVETTDDKYEEYIANAAEAMDVSADRIAYAKLLDISIVKDGEEIIPETPVDVQIRLLDRESFDENESLNVIHYESEDENPVLVGGSEQDGVVSFEAEGFSVYGLFYTVDFHWEVNGKMYEFSLPGGGFVSFYDLIEVLGISHQDANGESTSENGENSIENAENQENADVENPTEVPGMNSQDKTALTLEDVVVSDATKDFVADVESVVFSSPELVDVGKVESETTVGELKESRGLEVQYSAGLTEEQIEEINKIEVESGDWALISMLPFDTEESLTVSMKSGDVFTIKVTDTKDPLGIDDRTVSFVYKTSDNTGVSVQSARRNDYDLQGRQVSYSLVGGVDYCAKEASVWLFEYDPAQQAYYITNGYHTDETVRYLTMHPDSNEITLESSKESAVPVKIEKNEDGTYRLLIDVNGNRRYLTFDQTNTSFYGSADGPGSNIHFCLPENSGDSASHKATLISAADLQPGQDVVIYQRVLYNNPNDPTDPKNDTYIYFAIDGGEAGSNRDSQMVSVLNSSDSIYWKGSPSIEWELVDVGNGYYLFKNTATGKYLAPKGDGSILQVPEDYDGDMSNLSISLPGKQAEKYTSQIANWDYLRNVTSGLHVALDTPVTNKTATITSVDFLGSDEFYFAVRDPVVQGELTEVDTVDSKSKGITIKMYDFYDTNTTDSGTRLSFMNNVLYRNWGEGVLPQGLVQRVLGNDGYPVTTSANGQTSNVSLSNIFESSGHVTGPTDANHLFIQSVYDSTGYYHYSSFENFARLPDGSNDFVVYEQIGTPAYSGHQDDWNRAYMNRGNFMPFNELDVTNRKSHTYYGQTVWGNYYQSENSEPLPDSDPRKGEDLYMLKNLPDGRNYFFGMIMEAKFLQGPNGLNERDDPMRYEFNGDDDMWIFADNVLLLDLGGVHDAFQGYIDFRTGIIEVLPATHQSQNMFPGQLTTIKDQFQAAGVFPDGTPWDDSKVNEYFDGDTFKDYSVHDFKMFYMERGAGASNLEMQFNLMTIQEDAFRVTKEMPDTATHQDVQGDLGKVDFYYKAYTKLDGRDVYVTKTKFEQNATYLDGTPVIWYTDDIFILKPGQTAIFPVFDGSVNYYVEEVEPNETSHMLDDYVVTNSDPEAGQDANKQLVTREEKVRKRGEVKFQNHPDDSIVNELQIVKHLEGELIRDANGNLIPAAETSSPYFEYKVFLENGEGEVVPYSLGAYYQLDANGNFVYYTKDDNRRHIAGFSKTIDSQGIPTYTYTYYSEEDGETLKGDVIDTVTRTTPLYTEHTSQNGSIGDIRPGDTIYIWGLLEGTDFLVYERVDRSNIYKGTGSEDGLYIFEGTEVENAYVRPGELPVTHDSDLFDVPDYSKVSYSYAIEDDNAARGAILPNNKDAKVTVKNRGDQAFDIELKKNWPAGFDFNLLTDDTKVTFTVQRYLLSDKYGSFTLYGTVAGEIPDGVNPIYQVMKNGMVVKTIRFRDMTGDQNARSIVVNDLPVGEYTVVCSADVNGYEQTTSDSSSVSLTVTANTEEGQPETTTSPNTVSFTSTYTQQKAVLIIRKSMTGPYTSDTDFAATYTVKDAKGAVVATKYCKYNEIEEGIWNSEQISLPLGYYTVTEEITSTIPTGVVHSPVSHTIHLPVKGYVATAEFTGEYTQPPINVYIHCGYSPNNAGNGWTENGSTYICQNITPGNSLEITFNLRSVRYHNRQYLYYRSEHELPEETLGATTGDGSIPYYIEGSEQVGQYRQAFAIPTGVSEYHIYLKSECDNAYWAPSVVSTKENTTRNATGRSKLMSTRGGLRAAADAEPDVLRVDIGPISNVIVNPDTLPTLTPSDDVNKKYVLDADWQMNVEMGRTGYTQTVKRTGVADDVKTGTLTQDVWQALLSHSSIVAKDSKGNVYYYCITAVSETQVPKGTEPTIDQNGSKTLVTSKSDPHTLTVSNSYTPLGSLIIQKEVTVNGEAVTDHTNQSPADGTYTFKVTKKNDTSFVERTISITITNGVATSSEEITNLDAGVYVVEEVVPENGTTLTKINGTATASYSGEVTVVAGNTGSSSATILFTNNIGQTEISVKKVDADKASDAADRFLEKAKFSLYDSQGHSVSGITSIKITDLDTGSVITPGEDDKFTIPITGIKISGLPDGSYQLVEKEAPAGYVITNAITTFTVSQGEVTEWSLDGTASSVFEIPNPPGAALPNTGGPGTNLIYLFGFLMTGLAGAGLVMKRRRRNAA